MALFGRYHAQTNNELIQYLKRSKIIKSDRVFNVMNLVDRAKYTTSRTPYDDIPHGIGYGVTISAPHMHAYALEILENKLQNGNRVLDVGSGSGYLTACMGMMLGTNGVVIGIEHIPELQAIATRNIETNNPELLNSGRVELVVGDGREGYATRAPYDAIHVGAAAEEVPHSLIDQLAPGGRMLVPIGPANGDQTLVQIDKTSYGEIKHCSLMNVVFVPLTDKNQQCRS
ncbi:hypothetical protein PV327_007413 [Microctonus hyperodae]|uniref:Protein-L-isoaspartate O-methyltransferase n=1 Tax=Microctonus hyperodae TaxID=165561 RepID=A0AA39FZ47_MICHY|nr:hypothetical protein PV327_007413 [Microctonus hyperodae]